MKFKLIIEAWHKFKAFQQRVFNFLVLHIVYFVGIGLTALVAKVVGKKFLTKSYKSSSWETAATTKTVEPDRMY